MTPLIVITRVFNSPVGIYFPVHIIIPIIFLILYDLVDQLMFGPQVGGHTIWCANFTVADQAQILSFEDVKLETIFEDSHKLFLREGFKKRGKRRRGDC